MAFVRKGNELVGQYVVALRGDQFGEGHNIDAQRVEGEARRLSVKYGCKLRFVYTSTYPGFSVESMSEAGAIALSSEPSVERVEEDQRIRETSSIPWGLDRIDQSDGLNDSFNPPNGGEGVTVYVLDTGITTTHDEFEGRAIFGESFVGQGVPGDCKNHGTGVASVIGGKTLGVARKVSLVDVRIRCPNEGDASTMIKGVDWVAENAQRPAVVNISSILTDASENLASVVAQALRQGITFVVAAGNDGVDVCGISPPDIPGVIVVAASTRQDEKWTHSNTGTCVDLFAPGKDIPVASSLGGERTDSGTSYAAPHVSGVAAIFLSANKTALPNQVRQAIIGGASMGKISNPGSIPNRLLFSGIVQHSPSPFRRLMQTFVHAAKSLRDRAWGR